MRKIKEETEQTVQQLVDISKALFAKKGYASVSMEEIVEKANLTRGAVYHHFKSKKGLFRAVFEDVQKEISEQIDRVDNNSEDLWEQLIEGCRLFVVAASETDTCHILLIDGPAVLGWDTFRKMDQEYSMNLLANQIELMQKQFILKKAPVQALTHCLSGAMNEAALWIAEHKNRKQAIKEVMVSLEGLLIGFKQQK